MIELLVVIAIISLLVSILLPSLTKAKELARAVICSTNLKQIGSTLHLYVADNDGWIPGRFTSYDSNGNTSVPPGGSHWNTRLIYLGYLEKTSNIFYCPSFPPSNYEMANELFRQHYDYDYDPASQMVMGYGMRVWVNPGQSLASAYVRRDHEISIIHSPSDFFLVADSVYIGLSHPEFHEKQFYGISPGASAVGQRVRIQHADRANAVFADGSARPEDADYFLDLHTRQGEYSRREGYLTWSENDPE